MKTAINIGNEISMKEAAEPVAKAIVDVLNAISAGRIEREIAIEALKVVGLTAGVQGVTVRDCNITNHPAPRRAPLETRDWDSGEYEKDEA